MNNKKEQENLPKLIEANSPDVVISVSDSNLLNGKQPSYFPDNQQLWTSQLNGKLLWQKRSMNEDNYFWTKMTRERTMFSIRQWILHAKKKKRIKTRRCFSSMILQKPGFQHYVAISLCVLEMLNNNFPIFIDVKNVTQPCKPADTPSLFPWQMFCLPLRPAMLPRQKRTVVNSVFQS